MTEDKIPKNTERHDSESPVVGGGDRRLSADLDYFFVAQALI
jgi:hypothetical protein